MSNYLRQSTASQSKTLGPFIDDTDFKTPKTALTIANTDIKLMVDGGASANKNSGGGTHRVNGHYGVTFDATDTATVGELEVSVVVSGALPVWKTFRVLEEAVYDMLVAASAPGYITNAPVNVAQFGGSNLTSASGIPEVKVASIAANAITAAATAADFSTEVNAAVLAVLPAALVGGRIDASVGAMAANVLTATAINADAITAAKIADNAIDNATLAADTGLKSIRSNTAQAGASGTITLDASASAVDDFYNYCLIYITGGTGAGQARFITDYVGATKVASISPNWVTNPDNTSTFAIRAFGQVPGASAPTVAEIADGVWDEALSGHSTAGSAGKKLTDLDTTAVAVGSGGIGVSSFAAGAIDAAAIAANAIGSSEIAANAIGSSQLAQSAGQEIADEVLNRDLAGGGSGNTRNVRNALRVLRNKVDIVAGVATIYQEDDSTEAWHAAITTTAGNPISTVDPS